MISKIGKFPCFLFILGTVLFFVLRLINLDIVPVFVDEAIYVRWAQIMKNESTLRFLPLSDGKQPLFMWLVIPSLKLIADPLIAGRIISVASGLGTIIGVAILSFLLTRNMLISALAYLLFSLTPFFVFFDRMALVDSLLSMFGIWSIIIGFLLIRSPRLDLSMILGFILGGGLLTKSPAIFFYLWQIVLGLIYFNETPRPERPGVSRQGKNIISASFTLGLKRPKVLDACDKSKKNIFKLLGGWLVALIISQSIFNILRLGPNFHLINSRNQDYLYSYSEVLTHITTPLIYNLQNSFSWITLLLSFSTLILIIISLFSRYRRHALFILIIFTLPLIAQSLIAKVYTSRYLLFFVSPLIISAAIGLEYLVSKFKFKPIILIFLLLPLITSWGYVNYPEKANLSHDMRSGYLQEWTAGTGQKVVAQYLINESNKGAKIVVGTEGSFGTLPDGLQIYTEGHSNITVIGVGLPIIGLPSALKNTSKDNQIYFVLNKSRNQLDSSEIAKMKLINAYPKAARNDGSFEELQFYQLLTDEN